MTTTLCAPGPQMTIPSFDATGDHLLSANVNTGLQPPAHQRGSNATTSNMPLWPQFDQERAVEDKTTTPSMPSLSSATHVPSDQRVNVVANTGGTSEAATIYGQFPSNFHQERVLTFFYKWDPTCKMNWPAMSSPRAGICDYLHTVERGIARCGGTKRRRRHAQCHLRTTIPVRTSRPITCDSILTPLVVIDLFLKQR